MNFLEKIQNLPIGKRKIILWSIMAIICAGLIFFYIKNIQKKFRSFEMKEFEKGLGLPKFQEELNKLPKIK